MIAYCNIAFSLGPDSNAVYLSLLMALTGDIFIPRIISALVYVFCSPVADPGEGSGPGGIPPLAAKSSVFCLYNG